MKLKFIYKPQGRALEYAPLALDVYNGCTHRCKYCYIMTSGKIHVDDYYDDPAPKAALLEKVESDLEKLRSVDNQDEILVSFKGDPYQPAEMDLRITHVLIKLLRSYEQPFTILTKGGMRAARDFYLVRGYDKARYGTTLIFLDQEKANEWEPNAATVDDRIKAIQVAHDAGIPTWVSIEPVIDPDEALQIVDALAPIVDAWKIGKINYHKEIEDQVDWIKFRDEMKRKLDKRGATYYLKKSLSDL
jgi:DNA repair photolyase